MRLLVHCGPGASFRFLGVDATALIAFLDVFDLTLLFVGSIFLGAAAENSERTRPHNATVLDGTSSLRLSHRQPVAHLAGFRCGMGNTNSGPVQVAWLNRACGGGARRFHSASDGCVTVDRAPHPQ